MPPSPATKPFPQYFQKHDIAFNISSGSIVKPHRSEEQPFAMLVKPLLECCTGVLSSSVLHTMTGTCAYQGAVTLWLCGHAVQWSYKDKTTGLNKIKPIP